MNPELVYPEEEGAGAVAAEPLAEYQSPVVLLAADVLFPEEGAAEPPAEYQSPVLLLAAAAAGLLLGAAQLACGLVVAVVVGFAGDPQSSQSSLSAVSFVPAVDPDAGADDEAYGFEAPTPLSLLAVEL